MREKDVDNILRRLVKEAGGEVRKVTWTSRRGAPDRLVLLPDRCFWVELKRPGEQPEAHQVREIERMRASGCVVFVCDSEESIIEAINRTDSTGRVAKGSGRVRDHG